MSSTAVALPFLFVKEVIRVQQVSKPASGTLSLNARVELALIICLKIRSISRATIKHLSSVERQKPIYLNELEEADRTVSEEGR